MYTLYYKQGTWEVQDQITKDLSPLNLAYNLIETIKGELWVSTDHEGLIKIIFEDSKAENLKVKTYKIYTLDHGIGSMNKSNFFDFEGRLLITNEKGIYEYEEKTDIFKPFEDFGTIYTKGNLGVNRILVDYQNNYWLSTNKNDRHFIHIATKKGQGFHIDSLLLKPLYGSVVESLALDSNSIWISTSDGLYQYRTNFTKNYQTPFQALIRRVEADSLLFAGNAYEGMKSPVLSYEQHNLRFSFAATSYENEKMNQFSYRLEGYDTEWSVWTHEAKKEYTNLPEGNYTFRLKARNIYGLESPETSYTFEILPPLYRTWFAYFFYFVLIGFVVSVLIKYYTQRLKKENLKLEKLILDRTAEVTEKNTELLQQTEELQQANEEVLVQRDNLEKSYENVQTLSEIGQKITATLNLQEIFEQVYDHVNHFMDATIFGVGLYNESKQTIDYELAIERGVKYLPYQRDMRDKSQLAVQCIEDKKEILANEVFENKTQLEKTVLADGSKVEKPLSLVYLPLFGKENKVLGVITVQSFQKNAYSQRELNFLRNIAIYTAIALENAEAYKNLQATLDHLKATQAQLVQAEKMAGIGTLTAGIAHEINNPINFVKNNIENVEANLADILEVMREYEKITPEIAEAKLLEINKLKKKKDFEIAVEEMGELVRGIKEGANRTAEIVRSLRTFTRLDDQALQAANLHENLDSTLMLLQNQYKDRIEIVKNYGQIPLVNCFIGKINQVFMNLLANAVQAVEGKGTITITTVLRSEEREGRNLVEIRIKDSGKGIPLEIRDKIFEPFFTTKDVGKGTGLGLSISLGIVQNHGGDLRFESEIGQGTEFVLVLPVE